MNSELNRPDPVQRYILARPETGHKRNWCWMKRSLAEIMNKALAERNTGYKWVIDDQILLPNVPELRK